MYKTLFILVLGVFLTSCSKSVELESFDKEGWVSDKNGCGGDRKTIANVVMSQKDRLMGLEQKQLIELLGKPDKYELYKRSQYFFVYSVDPGSSCADFNKGRTANITIRFNALGKVNEVVYYQ